MSDETISPIEAARKAFFGAVFASALHDDLKLAKARWDLFEARAAIGPAFEPLLIEAATEMLVASKFLPTMSRVEIRVAVERRYDDLVGQYSALAFARVEGHA